MPQEQRYACSSQRMDFSVLALHISASAQDIKILVLVLNQKKIDTTWKGIEIKELNDTEGSA